MKHLNYNPWGKVILGIAYLSMAMFSAILILSVVLGDGNLGLFDLLK